VQKISLKNTLTGKKETFKPLEEDHVKIYACGVTTYDDCHIGHAMQAIAFDVIRNYFEYVGYRVTYVRNYTDVDDKIIVRAKERGITPLELSSAMIKSTDDDMAALGIRQATHQPKVSEMIPEIISMVETIIKNDAGYSTPSGDVYYRVRSKDDYGKLSNRNPDDMRSGSRDIVQGEKEDPLDFALWKADSTEGASWKSPWGHGRPGWHIECSAMSKALLGDTFDIHGGGLDLVFPHHENEIAQSESCNHAKYVNYWMHSGLMSINNQKMSKSLGNHISIKDFLNQYPAEVLRLSYLNQRYSSNVGFTQDLFKKNRSRLLYYYETLVEVKEAAKLAEENGGQIHKEFDPEAMRRSFNKAMSDDFNFGKAISEISVLMKKARQILSGKKNKLLGNSSKNFLEFLNEIAPVLGLLDKDPSAFIADLKEQMLPETGMTKEQVEAKISERNEARTAKDWKLSDTIRDELLSKGIVIKDGESATTWSISSEV
jgi:cysteinyl-tRNA synthetase